ncbi:MAG TPA: DNA polymerase III subunit alpha [Steroidobacteraceae bacterium]|nr:DNA polymerase III subunit alpha [Steroidobacteraceae bacterium]
MSAGFVHLRLHTEYSLIDSVVRVPELIEAVAAAGMPAVAATDQSNLFAMVKFYRAALARGVKPIIGVDLLVREPGERQQPARITFICQNQTGYLNATRLVSRAYLEGQQRGVPLIERGWLTPQTLDGLIALSGATEGDVGRALVNGREDDAARALDSWLALLPDRYYIELQRLGRADEESYIAAAVNLAGRRGIPVVATNDVRFLKQGDFESHEARVCIRDGTLLGDASRVRRYTSQQYLRSPEEMSRLFADIPEALANSVEIARRASLTLKLGQPRLPPYPVPGGMSTEDFLRQEAQRGFEKRLQEIGGTVDPQVYPKRLQAELDVICKMGFAGYFLIVADFIRWAKENGVPVGPGRGSGAGSLVAYSLRITDLDPLRYDLLFERFLNPERVSMPDFDVDFCMEGRDRVIDYVADHYGRERVSQIITYGTMAAKAVVRDVGRVLGMTYGFVDKIAKLIPFELGITLDDALQKEPELKRLYDSEEEVRNLIDLARSLEGLTRNAGMHAGGVVIAPSVLTDFAPLYCDESGGSLVTQFDKDDVEAAGLVKFDFLGLRTLTVIDWTVKAINARRAQSGEPALDITKIPLDDAFTYDRVFKRAQTVAVFQFESGGMQRMLKEAKADRFDDLIALGALYRPGPMDLIPEYIACKHGKKPEYLHSDMEQVLGVTYGVFVYQEQVMQIAQRLAGYTLGGADLLRRAMGKKKPEEMAKQRSVFVAGAAAQSIGERIANAIFDQMEKFAGYGFNKSHAAAYALLSYQTAYLKAHFPAAFMAAMLSADMDHTDKVVTLIHECEVMKLKVRRPDINTSFHEFTVDGDAAILYGLGAVRGVGRGAVEALIAEREARGPFIGMEDLCRRIDLQKINRRVLEALLRSGSLDALGTNRATLMQRLPAAIQLGDQNSKAHEAGQNDLFGLGPAPAVDAVGDRNPAQASAGVVSSDGVVLQEWTEAVRLAGERETLGLYLTGHPAKPFGPLLARVVSHWIGDLVNERPPAGAEPMRFGGGKRVTVGGLVDEVKKRGTRFILTLDDSTGRLEVQLFEDIYLKYRDIATKDALVVVEGMLRFDDFSDGWRVTGQSVTDLRKIGEQQARNIVLTWPQDRPDTAALQVRLAEVLAGYRPGPCTVVIRYSGSAACGELKLGSEWAVRATGELQESLEGLLGRGSVDVKYAVLGATSTPPLSADGR